MRIIQRAAFAAFGAAAGLAMTAAAAFDTAYVSSERPLGAYEQVYVAPVSVELDHDVRRYRVGGSGDRPVEERDAALRAEDFHAALTDAFGRSFALAGAPGPGVLTVEARLIKLESSRPTMADYRQTPGLSARSVYAGGAEMHVTISEDGVLLAEIGDAWRGSLDDGRYRIGLWDDARRAFGSWARRLARFVEQN